MAKFGCTDLINYELLNIGEMFVDGQNRNVWCDSKKPITDVMMYDGEAANGHITDPIYRTRAQSCFRLFWIDSVMKLFITQSCPLSETNKKADYFMCE